MRHLWALSPFLTIQLDLVSVEEGSTWWKGMGGGSEEKGRERCVK
jgi:hypothetical protein